MINTTHIYALQDPRCGSVKYIGKANNPDQRLVNHLAEASGSCKTKKNNWIKSLKNKGLEPSMAILDVVQLSEWEFWEQWYIELFKSWGFGLMNMENGGNGAGKISQETRKKMSESRIGRKLSEATKQKISRANKGKKRSEEVVEKCRQRRHTDESKKKIGEAGIGRIPWNKGVPMSEETRSKCGEANKGRELTEEHKRKISQSIKGMIFPTLRKPVKKIHRDTGKEIEYYEGLSIAAEQNNIPKANINAVCKGRRKTAGGYTWEYV